jgi:hypothetical protein
MTNELNLDLLMTLEERNLLIRLDKCRFVPGSYEKRFVREMAALARSDTWWETFLTEKQRAFIQKIAHRYRNQLGGIT